MSFTSRSVFYWFFVVSLFFSAVSIAGPALFKVEKNGVSSYLFGTVHVGDKSMAGLPKNVLSAIEKSDKVVVEVNLNALSKLEIAQRSMPFITLPAGHTLQSILSKKNYQILNSYLSNKGINIALFNQSQPWVVLIQLLLMEYQKAGFSEKNGIDKQVLAHAKTLKLPVMELETLEQQLEIFTQLGIKSNKMFEDTFKQLNDINHYFIDLVTGWKRGDMQTLSKYYHIGFDDSDYGQFAEQVMLVQRNHNWIEQLTVPLGKTPHFIAVGALHLPEKDGLIALLKAKGFTITRL